MRASLYSAAAALALMISPGLGTARPAHAPEPPASAAPTEQSQSGGGQQLSQTATQIEQAAQNADEQSREPAVQQARQALDGLEQALQQSAQGSSTEQQTQELQGQIDQARQQLDQDPQQAADTLQQIAQTAQQAGGAQQQAQIPAEADRIVGKKIMSSQGDEVGEVNDVLVTGEGHVEAVLVEQGGTMGMGGKQVALQWNQIQIQGDQLTVSMSPDQLEQLPEYQAE